MINRLRGFGEALGQQDLDPAQCFDGRIRDGRFEPTDLRSDDPDFESRFRIGRWAFFSPLFGPNEIALVFAGSQRLVREPADRAPTTKGLLVHRRTSYLPP